MAISRVASSAATANSAASSVTTLNIVLGVTPTAGNIVAIAFATTSQLRSVTCTNISFQIITNSGASASTAGLIIGRVFASASATITVEIASSGSIALAGAEYTGSNIRIDRTVNATGSSTSAASGATATTETANELWLGAIGTRLTNGVTYSSPTNSFAIVNQDKTSVATTNDRSVALLEQFVSATGTANAGATLSSSGIWVSHAITFSEVTSGASATSSTY